MKKSEPEERPLCKSSTQLSSLASTQLVKDGYNCAKNDETFVESQDENYKVKVKRLHCTHTSKSPMVLVPEVVADNEAEPSCFNIVGTKAQINEQGTGGLQ
ncbi:MAG: hypothetical protein KBD78_12295 [Oligoflexales bacterium]|nr:hypothetical protein [Oligoflexales bacterium]